MSAIKDKDLVFHILNVGFGDNILVEFPAGNDGLRSHGLVDCYNYNKTKEYLEKLRGVRPARKRLDFICATHPHSDHIKGIPKFLKDPDHCPKEFWDSGFRHNSKTYRKILGEVAKNNDVRMLRVTSGMEWYYGRVRVTALAPSIEIRNRYATYGVDMNNASIVLRFEHYKEDVVLQESERYKGKVDPEMLRRAGSSVVILGGDAEFDSWAKITEEYPKIERSSKHEPLVKKMVNRLSCGAIKISHHGSMHSSPLDVYEKMSPKLAVASTEQKTSTKRIDGRSYTRELFPHKTASLAVEEVGAELLTTDGSYEREKRNSDRRYLRYVDPGSIIIKVPPGGRLKWTKLNDSKNVVPDPPTNVPYS